MKNQTIKLEIDFPINYKLTKRKSKKLLILLHGFAQTNEAILEHFLDSAPDDYDILAPNGPLPIPKIRRDYIEKRYAWYFFDRHSNSYDIDYSLSANLLQKLVQTLGYDETPKVVIGYSQGGYLSPFAGLAMNKIQSIIGLCCTYKWQYITEELPFNVYSIHGVEDKLVDHQNSKVHFEKLKTSSKKESRYISLKNEGHDLSDNIVQEALKLI
ncbi:alpha/beta hydrolase [Halobacteriovorax sp.]|uniref:alpha/beta hydrolase n=1 Tax=Halobacteriovorax sp. TaxID=2020862 RepID=UPI0035660F94